jgi:hypothetical protein
VALGLRVVFVLRHGVELHPEIQHVASHGFELVVHESESQSKSALTVQLVDVLHPAHDARDLAILQHFDGAKLDMLGDSDKEWNSAHKHNVNPKSHVSVFLHDPKRNRVILGSYSWAGSSCRLPLKGTEVGSE